MAGSTEVFKKVLGSSLLLGLALFALTMVGGASTRPVARVTARGGLTGSRGTGVHEGEDDIDLHQLQTIRDQSSLKYSIHWDVSGAPAAALTTYMESNYGKLPGFYPSPPEKGFTLDVTGSYINAKPAEREKTSISNEKTEVLIWSVDGSVAAQVGTRATDSEATPVEDRYNLYPFTYVWDNTLWGLLGSTADDFECKTVTERINGRSVQKCSLSAQADIETDELLFYGVLNNLKFPDNEDDVSALEDQLSANGPQSMDGLTADFWLTDEATLHGLPVRFNIAYTGKDANGKAMKYQLKMDVTDVASKSFTIDMGK